MDSAGVIRVGHSRVLVDTVLLDYKAGATPEEIANAYDTLELGDVYAVIALYHYEKMLFEDYLERRGRQAAELRREIETSQR